MLLIGILITFSPPVGAQVCPEALPNDASLEFLGFTIEGLDDGVLDPYDTTTITADFEYKAPMQAFSLDPVPVTLEAKASQSWLQLGQTAVLHTVRPEPGIEDHNETLSITTNAMLTQHAVQGETATIIFTASAEGGTCVNPVDEVMEPLEFTVGFYEEWAAEFDETIVRLSTTETAFLEGHLDSESNGPMVVDVVLAAPPRLGTVTLPEPFTVQAGKRGDFTVSYRAESPGWDEVVIRLDAESQEDPERALRDWEMSVQLGVDDTETNSLPSAPIPAVLTVVAVATLALKKRS